MDTHSALSPQQLAEWFPRQLVSITESVVDQPALALPFLGQNGKKILVLVHEKGFAHTADQHLDFLVSVLQACRLGLADIALVNVAEKNLNWTQLLEQFQPTVTLAFQVDTQALGLPFVVPHYKVYAHGPLRFLPLPPLADYLVPDAEKAKAEKKLLWAALKTLFNI
jgi:hypothetical protein